MFFLLVFFPSFYCFSFGGFLFNLPKRDPVSFFQLLQQLRKIAFVMRNILFFAFLIYIVHTLSDVPRYRCNFYSIFHLNPKKTPLTPPLRKIAVNKVRSKKAKLIAAAFRIRRANLNMFMTIIIFISSTQPKCASIGYECIFRFCFGYMNVLSRRHRSSSLLFVPCIEHILIINLM